MFRLSTANIINDSRILREAGTLAEEHEVHVLDLSIYSGKRRETYDGFQVESIRLVTKRLPKNLLFWVIKYIEYLLKVMARALALRADVYHAYNLDTLLPAWIAAKLRGSSVVYYARELYVETSGMRGIQRLPGFATVISCQALSPRIHSGFTVNSPCSTWDHDKNSRTDWLPSGAFDLAHISAGGV